MSKWRQCPVFELVEALSILHYRHKQREIGDVEYSDQAEALFQRLDGRLNGCYKTDDCEFNKEE